MQRSTVSLIVDELIKDGWIVEGEHVRIPRGRRPIFLQINAENAGLVGLHVHNKTIEMVVSNLNSAAVWSGREEISEFSFVALGNALRRLRDKAAESHDLEIKGVGIVIDSPHVEIASLQEAVKNAFNAPSAIESVPVACAKWFMLSHKDAAMASGHLVSINTSSDPALGVIIAGHALRGAHGQAGALLNETHNPRNNGSDNHRSNKIDLSVMRKRLDFAVAAYDPGVILVTGNIGGDAENIENELLAHLKQIGAGDTAVRAIDDTGDGVRVNLKAALAVVLTYLLDECPI